MSTLHIRKLRGADGLRGVRIAIGLNDRQERETDVMPRNRNIIALRDCKSVTSIYMY